MKRRIIAAVAALLMAAVGAVQLYSYVQHADQRAMAGLETSEVLVVEAPIAEGTPADQLSELVGTKTLPAMALAEGAALDLDQLNGLVANTALQPGEQVITARFSDPAALDEDGTAPLPKRMQEVSLMLDSQRALGGNLAPGDTVGVFFSVDGRTDLGLHGVLVSRVQGGLVAAPSEKSSGGTAPLPETSVMVTLAVSAANAERVVHAAENGTIWLSNEPTDAAAIGTSVVTGKSVNQ
jgi:pilus assembly protein CpaB